MRIAEMGEHCRPRERFLQYGISMLSDTELLAILLQKGTRKQNVLEVATHLLAKQDLDSLPRLSLKELQKVKGIGPLKAMQLKAAFELGRRVRIVKKRGQRIQSAKDVFTYTHPIIARETKEHFMVIHLDSQSRIIKHEIVSIGTLNSSLIHPREVFLPAVREHANAIILAHNHPSGNPSPSQEDKEITVRLFEAGELLAIPVLDHVIIGHARYFSFKEYESSYLLP